MTSIFVFKNICIVGNSDLACVFFGYNDHSVAASRGIIYAQILTAQSFVPIVKFFRHTPTFTVFKTNNIIVNLLRATIFAGALCPIMLLGNASHNFRRYIIIIKRNLFNLVFIAPIAENCISNYKNYQKAQKPHNKSRINTFHHDCNTHNNKGRNIYFLICRFRHFRRVLQRRNNVFFYFCICQGLRLRHIPTAFLQLV